MLERWRVSSFLPDQFSGMQVFSALDRGNRELGYVHRCADSLYTPKYLCIKYQYIERSPLNVACDAFMLLLTQGHAHQQHHGAPS